MNIFYTGLNLSLLISNKISNINVLSNLPNLYDYRYISGNIPIRDQGGCGSCWAFATIAPIEFLIKNRLGNIPDLSEQYLVSCNGQGFNCPTGGWWAFDEFRNGIVYEKDFKYVASDIQCIYPEKNNNIKVNRWAYISGTDQIKSAIMQYGPVVSAISTSNEFYGYRSGIFSYASPNSVSHAITIVGWNDSYWIIRNSWGESWGMKGYMYITYGVSNVGSFAAYVVLDIEETICIPSRSPSNSPSPSPSPSNSPSRGPKRIYCNTTIFDSSINVKVSDISNCIKAPSYGLAVWFYLLPESNNISINTFGSNYDTQLSVYNSNMSCIGNNDDYGGTYQSFLLIKIPILSGIYIVVHGYGSRTGLINLTISCV